MNIRTGSITFPPLRGSGPLQGQSTVIFPRTVLRAIAGLTNYSVGFANQDDHHFGRLDIELNCTINNDAVTVMATYGLRDWSGNWDDEYQGVIEFVVIAELESQSAPPRRTDMVIVGAEFNQAIQFFRSCEHLDLMNAMPDNSIRLIGGKNTGVRLYTDFDSTGGAMVGHISGVMRLTASSGAEGQISPIADITPISEISIDRGNVGHTLNFMIPGVWCHGVLTIECELFDNTNPATKSVPYQRTLRFIDAVPLQVFCVGIHYTGQGLNLAAPDINDCVSTLDWVERVYPTGETMISGYSTTDFSKDMKPKSSSGCSDGFNDLLDDLADLRGGGDELYLGILPNGIDVQIDNTGWFNTGCDGNSGISAVFNGDGESSAHELGHAFGRDHSPCNDSGRCDDPQNQNDDYPHYGVYQSDSIGEYGYDPIFNTVFDPAVTYDFMGYSSPKWVSPYTYSALMGHLAAVDGGAVIGSDASPVPMLRRQLGRRQPEQALFLRLTMDLHGKFTAEPSYTHEVKTVPVQRPSEYAVELRDVKGEVISRNPLNIRNECYCRISQARKIRQIVSLKPEAVTLAVLHKGQEVFCAPLGAAPDIIAEIVKSADNMIEVHWKPNSKEETSQIWTIVQGLDSGGIWRGLSLRTCDNRILLNAAIMKQKHIGKLRLLATETLSTKVIDLNYEPEEQVGATANIVVKLVAPNVFKAWVIGEDGPEVAKVVWCDEKGSEIGRGHTLDLRRKRLPGKILVTATSSSRFFLPKTLTFQQSKEQLILIQETTPIIIIKKAKTGKPNQNQGKK